MPYYDDPAFALKPEYIDEMQRFGILPADVDNAAINVFATDRKYWESLWWQPAGLNGD
jgi:hypothetical protein